MSHYHAKIHFLIIPLLLFIVLATHGYRFGDQDQSETLSYAKHLSQPFLYPNDLYIQAVSQSHLNERFPFTYLLTLTGKHLEWGIFILQMISSFFVIAGWWALAKRYLASLTLQILFLLLIFIPLYNINLGGNEMYYPYFVPSHLAKTLGVWAIVFFLEDKVWPTSITLVLSTLAQPIVGAQLALIFILCYCYRYFQTRKWKLSWIPPFALYLIIAGSWLGILFYRNMILDAGLSVQEFYLIMESRLAHHWFPAYYPATSYLILAPIIVGGWWSWYKIDQKLFVFFSWVILGLAVYTILVEQMEWSTILSTQWFKTTVWLKPLAVLGIFAIIKRKFLFNIQPIWGFGIVAIALVMATYQFSQQTILNRPYHFPFSNYHTPIMRMALEAREKLPIDASIIIPPNETGFRYFSERSMFIDYKSNIHTKAYLAESYRRRSALYGMDIELRRSGNPFMPSSMVFYDQLEEADILPFKEEGATHILVNKSVYYPSFEISLENEAYRLYKL